MLIVGGLVLTLGQAGAIRPFSKLFWQQASALVATACVTAFVFGPLDAGNPNAWALFPLLVVCALLGGPSLTTKALLLIAAGALWGSASGYGPFPAVSDKLGTLQQFLGAASLTSLILAAVATERRDKGAIEQRSQDLHFLSEAAIELLSSSVLAASVQKMTFLRPFRTNSVIR